MSRKEAKYQISNKSLATNSPKLFTRGENM